MSNHNFETVFIPVSDMDTFIDYDQYNGYGGCDQLTYGDGIVVKKEEEEQFRKLVEQFEDWRKNF